jgi:hypothetical protein
MPPATHGIGDPQDSDMQPSTPDQAQQTTQHLAMIGPQDEVRRDG